MKKTGYFVTLATIVVLLAYTNVMAHCEIPCGIYDDELRIELIYEHITTIEKSMKSVMELSKKIPINYNQLIRWISNKEKHANEIQHIVAQYFLTQRIKFDAKDYQKKLTVLHGIMVYGMKCKQTTDINYVSKLRSLVREFEILYFGHSHGK